MSWLVDAHVHYHPVFGWSRFLEGVLSNTARVSGEDPSVGAVTTTCLLLADPPGTDSLRELREGPGTSLPPDWDLRTPDRGRGVVLTPPHGAPRIVLLAGRQLRTTERLELLALDCVETIPDGLSLNDAVDRAGEAGAIRVIPWGFGKWTLSRRRTVERVLTERPMSGLHVGDNGNRPGLSPLPRLLGPDRPGDVLNLPGSDPLPFPDHARRAASCGFVLPGDPDLDSPGASIRKALGSLTRDPPIVASRRSPVAFVADQLRMQLRGAGQ